MTVEYKLTTAAPVTELDVLNHIKEGGFISRGKALCLWQLTPHMAGQPSKVRWIWLRDDGGRICYDHAASESRLDAMPMYIDPTGRDANKWRFSSVKIEYT